VGFDINCGVRLLRTNLTEAQVEPVKEKLNGLLFKQVPLGVSSDGGLLNVTKKQLEVLNRGMEYPQFH
jgi:tRNA-splicing ligase RtcB (3'-phosphate/5'-hydroxy nucleic acid ligase)